MIQDESQMLVIGEASNGDQALKFIEEFKPDIAILDISMPGISGLDVAAEVRKRKYPIRIIILTLYDDVEYLEHAMEINVEGYLLKENATLELINCLDSVSKGKTYISKKVMDAMTSSYELKKTVQATTPTENKIIKLIGEGKTSKEIANILFVSYRTVQNHRANIANKLGLKGVNQLLKYAVELHRKQ